MSNVSLLASQLFQPAPSGVGPYGQLPAVPAFGTWFAVELQIAATVQLPTTAWQSGGPERTILAIEAVSFAQSDANISLMAQGGFLDSAATGTVTYVTPSGTTITLQVTPDPSNPAQNPTGSLGWLDDLTQNVYDTYRLRATYASGLLALANVGGSTINYAQGSYHLANVASGATYTNAAALAIPPSAIAGSGGVVSGVTPVRPGVTIIATVGAHGLAIGAVVYVNIPQNTGITIFPTGNPSPGTGFALVTSVTSNTFQIAVTSSGTWASGGTVYLCTQAQMTADVAGYGSNASPGTATKAITQNANVYLSNVVGWSGSNWESNVALASRARLALAAASPNGPANAYQFFAESAAQILAGLDPAHPLPVGQAPYTMTNGPCAAAVSTPVGSGVVTTTIASSTPASTVLNAAVTPGCAQNAIVGITNANPCVISCAQPIGITVGQSFAVTITGVLGVSTLVAAVNGSFTGTWVSASSFSIPVDTTLLGGYADGGSVEGGDLGQVDILIQANCVPDEVTAITQSALAAPVSVVATVAVPQAMVTTYQLAVPVALANLIANYAVGGNAPDYAVAYDDVVGALEIAGVLPGTSVSYVRQIVSLSLNGQGLGQGVTLGIPYQAVLVPPNIAVVGV